MVYEFDNIGTLL